jgi:hypothetical protein
MIQERAGKRNSWISFNDLNNLEVPFRGNTELLEKSNIHPYGQESDTWLTEDTEKVEIFYNLHGCPREDVGIEVLEMEDHHHYPHTYNCLRVFKKKNTSANKSGGIGSSVGQLVDPFEKVFVLPRDSVPSKMETNVNKDGRLVITIPKLTEMGSVA